MDYKLIPFEKETDANQVAQALGGVAIEDRTNQPAVAIENDVNTSYSTFDELTSVEQRRVEEAAQ
jgi:hypothetical protein